MDAGATIVVESGGSMTNFGSTSGDPFAGTGYGGLGAFVPNAITFQSNATFVLAAATNKGFISRATWMPDRLHGRSAEREYNEFHSAGIGRAVVL